MADLLKKTLVIAGVLVLLAQTGCLAATETETAFPKGKTAAEVLAAIQKQEDAAMKTSDRKKNTDQTTVAKAQVKEGANTGNQTNEQPGAVNTTVHAAKASEGNGAERFEQILSDNSFTYYMDKQSARWIVCPNTSNEHIVDVWIRLSQNAEGASEATQQPYSYPAKYYLEHYYIRPSREQIQFLCELEVTGRPANAVNQRAYSAANWENLVPGSIEDEIYHAVLKRIKKMPSIKGSGNPTLWDDIDEYLRISL